MERDKATKQLERIIGTIESGAMPWPIREVHVFGSYARGALNPGDLDIIVIYEPLTEAFIAQIIREAQVRRPHLHWMQVHPKPRFEARLQKLLRKPGEKIDIVFGESLAHTLGRLKSDKSILIWSTTDRNWRTKLAAITPDPQAGRHPRNHFANIRRFNSDLQTMERATSAIECGLLKLTRVPLESVNLNDLTAEYRDWLAHWINCRAMGKESLKLLPYGMWWIQHQEGQHGNPPEPPGHDCEMTSQDRRYSVFMGKPSLWPILCWRERTKAVCLLPHLKRDQPNELFIFERGLHYSEELMARHRSY